MCVETGFELMDHILRKDKWMHLQHSMVVISDSIACIRRDNTNIDQAKGLSKHSHIQTGRD